MVAMSNVGLALISFAQPPLLIGTVKIFRRDRPDVDLCQGTAIPVVAGKPPAAA